jgi:hypothetical protein
MLSNFSGPETTPLSTRELKHWFDHYQKASRTERERMIKHPRLFVQALNESAEQNRIERLRMGPEGACEVDLLRINGLIHRVRKRLPVLCPLSAELQRVFLRAQASFAKPSATRSSGIAKMIPIEIRKGVRLLRAQGQSLREIGRLLKLSRNAIRRILREKDGERAPAVLARLEEAFKRACGNGVRAQELLASETGLKAP